jgi:hypothetical protein
MSKIGVSLKLNLTAVDVARLFQGAKGQYLDATVFIDLAQLDQYGNSGMITQDVKKEEKDQGVKGNILGNCKVFWAENGQAPQPMIQPAQQQPAQAQWQQAPQQQAPMQQQPPQQQAPQNGGGTGYVQPQAQQQQPPAQQQAQQQPQQASPTNFGGEEIPF